MATDRLAIYNGLANVLAISLREDATEAKPRMVMQTALVAHEELMQHSLAKRSLGDVVSTHIQRRLAGYGIGTIEFAHTATKLYPTCETFKPLHRGTIPYPARCATTKFVCKVKGLAQGRGSWLSG